MKSIYFATFVCFTVIIQCMPNVVNSKLYFTNRSVGNKFDFLKYTYSPPEEVLKEYDFIIVGAGSTGSVLASRLSEDNKYSVLILEAGEGESFITDIPLLAAHLQHTDYNWGFKTEKQKGVCMAMDEQRCSWHRGKAVGGSSVINYMIYTRGSKQNWDDIAAAGNPGWSFDDVLPYFMKSERANITGLESSEFHNRNGLWSIEDVKYKTRFLEAFLESARELNHTIGDYNRGDQFGFSNIQTSTRRGRRQSASKAFLYPFKKRKNLHILTSSRVTKINIDEASKTAMSVNFVRNKMWHTIKAKKEIILSAGSLQSPQLLMLSGIGPKEHLKELGIKLIKDLKVGENMYDHVCYYGLIFLMNETYPIFTESNILADLNYAIQWLQNGYSPYSMIGGVEGIGYIQTNISDDINYRPDIEFLFLPGSIVSDRSNVVRKGLGISDAFFENVFGEIVEKPSWSLLPILMHPRSKGHLKLKDANPFHWPKFYYDYFSNEKDLLTLVEGIKYAIKMSNTKPFQKYGTRLHDKPFPTCIKYPFGTDEYWSCAVRSLATTLHHQIGTCKMGPITDPEAVVDHELKVHGINKLRVADASIIPIPLTAHTNAPSIMIGEKLADIIKSNWKTN